MLLLAAVLVPVCVLASWHDAGEDPQRMRLFFALVLVLETMMIGVFAARDVFLFYVFFEAMLIPMYFLIGSFGGVQGKFAAMKFLLFSLAGGLLMLVALIGLALVAVREADGGLASDAFLTSNLTGLDFGSVGLERWIFVGFFIAFAIKAPMWPVHTWLPDAAASATPGGAVLLVGVLDKVGTFGMITLCLPLFPGASRWAAPVIVVLAVISVLYGALLAIGQSDLKRLIAFTSISHFGFIVLGVFAMTSSGQAGSVLYMVNHGFSTAALFLAAGMFIARYGTSRIADYGGLQRVTPLLAGLVPGGRPVVAGAAGAVQLHQRVPRAGGHVRPLPGGGRAGHARHRPGRAVHPDDLPADGDRPGAGEHEGPTRTCGRARSGCSHRCCSSSSPSGSSRGRCSTSSTPRSSAP